MSTPRLAESMPALHSPSESEKESSLIDDSPKTNSALFSAELDKMQYSVSERSSTERSFALDRIDYFSASIGRQSENGQYKVLREGSKRSMTTPISDTSHSINPSLKRKSEDLEFKGENGAEPPQSQHPTLPLHTWLQPFNNMRLLAGKIVNDDRVQMLILLLISINAIMMGVASFSLVKDNEHIKQCFDLIDQILLIIFTIESGMQLLYHGWTLFKDGFLVFDLLVVVLSWAMTGTQVIRAFRIFRALRLVTRIDTMKNLVMALSNAFPKMVAILLLMVLIFYIFVVMFTQMFKGLYAEGQVTEPWFEGIGWSLFTLFQILTLVSKLWSALDICFHARTSTHFPQFQDEWAAILVEYQESGCWWAWMPFVVFVIITAFVVVNLLVAVICDAISFVGEESKGMMTQEACTLNGSFLLKSIYPQPRFTDKTSHMSQESRFHLPLHV